MNKMKLLVLALAALVGSLVRGETYRRRHWLANDKTPQVPDYKALHAEAIGIPKDKAKDMSDEDQLKAHKAHMKQVEALANDDEEEMPEVPAEDQAAAATANAKVTELETKLANEKTARETALANERKERAADLITAAIEAGRVKPADKPTWEAEFVTDFAAAKTKLANAKKGMKTTALTAGRGADSQAIANEQERRDQVQMLVNEKMEKGLSYDRAFAAVQREKPDLFDAMTKPEPKK